MGIKTKINPMGGKQRDYYGSLEWHKISTPYVNQSYTSSYEDDAYTPNGFFTYWQYNGLTIYDDNLNIVFANSSTLRGRALFLLSAQPFNALILNGYTYGNITRYIITNNKCSSETRITTTSQDRFTNCWGFSEGYLGTTTASYSNLYKIDSFDSSSLALTKIHQIRGRNIFNHYSFCFPFLDINNTLYKINVSNNYSIDPFDAYWSGMTLSLFRKGYTNKGTYHYNKTNSTNVRNYYLNINILLNGSVINTINIPGIDCMPVRNNNAGFIDPKIQIIATNKNTWYCFVWIGVTYNYSSDAASRLQYFQVFSSFGTNYNLLSLCDPSWYSSSGTQPILRDITWINNTLAIKIDSILQYPGMNWGPLPGTILYSKIPEGR